MNLEEIIARAVPPPERIDREVFEPAFTAPDAMERRRRGLVRAFGSTEALDAHARALGLTPQAWIDRFADVRLIGPDPDWARALRAVAERLSDVPPEFAAVRAWARDSALAEWPEAVPLGPDALEGPLDYLASRLGVVLRPVRHVEQRLGVRTTWQARLGRSAALAFAMGRVVADWIDDLSTMAKRAAADRELLSKALFGGENPGALLRIEAGLGDSHAGGRSVAILHFDHGAVVYKAKDLRIAVIVGDIVSRLECAGMVGPSLLVRDGYAWEPAHETAPLPAREDADAFFGALGGWLALLQALGGYDFWFDNLIANGRTPCFVDFETAVQPSFDWLRDSRLPTDEAADELFTVLPTGAGILPFLYAIGDGGEPTDMGCVTRPGSHALPNLDMGADGLVSWSESRFAPRLPGGEPVDAADHFDAFEDGYFRVARALADRRRQESIVESLRQVPDAPVRVILVDTWTCYRMVNQSLLPRCLSDGVWREIALHATITSTGRVGAGELREAAARDLRRIDIPLFHARLGSRDLFGVCGERRREVCWRDAISATRRRLGLLARRPQDERTALLRSGFGLRAGNPAWRTPTRTGSSPARPEDLLAWADEIASGIAPLTVRDSGGGPTWIGLTLDVFTGLRTLGRLGFDLLSGRAGIVRALLELARRLGRPELASLAREAAEAAARDYMEVISAYDRSCAGHAVGVGGLVTVLAADPELRPLAVRIFRHASERRVWMRSGGDFVSGVAGWRRATRALGESAPSVHGVARPYAPSARPRLARWLEPESAVPLCADHLAAARLRQDLSRHGSWFAESWLDDRHNLSGVDGVPALAVRFARLADET